MLSPVPYRFPGVGDPLAVPANQIGKVSHSFSHKDRKNVAKPTKDPPVEHLTVKFSFALSVATNRRFLRYSGAALGYHGGSTVIAKAYFVRQAAIVFGIAKATKDPKMSAALMDKAADLKSKVDGLDSPLDLTPLAPDIEPPAM